jgi:hypothetical protein
MFRGVGSLRTAPEDRIAAWETCDSALGAWPSCPRVRRSRLSAWLGGSNARYDLEKTVSSKPSLFAHSAPRRLGATLEIPGREQEAKPLACGHSLIPILNTRLAGRFR